MYGRAGLDRFKKAQSLEPFSVTVNSSPGSAPTSQPASRAPLTGNSSAQYSQPQTAYPQTRDHAKVHASQKPAVQEAAPLLGQTQPITQVGGGQSTWQPPDWAIEPRSGVYYLEVLKDGEVLDRIYLDKRRQIFGRQFHTCDFVLDHQSVSRQHAAVVPHKNGSVYVIDLGSAHGTFVANERLTKDTPVELEVGQSLRFAASTRSYILRKNNAALFPPAPSPSEINLPPPPDPSDEEAVVAYNTLVNRYGLGKSSDARSKSKDSSEDSSDQSQRAAKRLKRLRVMFKDQAGEKLVEIVGISDGADVETEPGPVGVKEGSLVGKYESLVQTTIIPKGKEQTPSKEDTCQRGVTDRLQEVLNKVKNPPKGGIYDDLYGESFSGKVGSSWAFSSSTSVSPASPVSPKKDSSGKLAGASGHTGHANDDDDDDLFG
ncbi:protein phosphatase 1 regulatory inhibitor subunit PPP1R8 homolog [Punica granatum]|uniref:FHA domain-containing protein n=2 Tax=Punica granatum TaxID=22663 RepID=A0A218XLK3_PUNGR|nr:protein phosphatase 1 regulatory inhibitor subunit PPP1R8 homolog [Punica granatum]OWM85660.1 hypothetical protein CDL15_Pgr029083 [Punica granatum]PKI71476.1 hypothetical protein CRG98_008149 [Punica granatum]